MGHKISKILNVKQCSALKSDVPHCFAFISATLCCTEMGVELETCLRMSPLYWDMSQSSKMFIANKIKHETLWYQIARY